jgi:hypothetical protein
VGGLELLDPVQDLLLGGDALPQPLVGTVQQFGQPPTDGLSGSVLPLCDQ